MIPATIVVLHGGHVELTLLEYLSRVLLHLLAFGAVATLAFWWSGAVGAVRSPFPTKRGSNGSEGSNGGER